MYTRECIDLSNYRLSKAEQYLRDAQRTLELEMYDTAANRSYYAIFHAARAVLALDGLDFKKHSGVVSNFQMRYIKTGVFDKSLSDIIKSAFSLRTESDYEDFYVIAKVDVENQVREAEIFCTEVRKYIEEQIRCEA